MNKTNNNRKNIYKMKTLKTSYLILAMLMSAFFYAACSNENIDPNLKRQINREIRESIKAEINNASLFDSDSVSDSKVIVIDMPQIQSRQKPQLEARDIFKITAIFTPFAFGFAILWLILRWIYRNNLAKYRLIEFSIEKGATLPDSFYASKMFTYEKKRFTSGITWIGIGLSIIVFALSVSVPGGIAFGILPIFIGISRILAFYIDNNNKIASNNANRDHNDNATA